MNNRRRTFPLRLLVVIVTAAPAAQAQTAPASPPPAGGTIDTDIEYYHLDALGSVRMVTNRTGEVVARYDYLPFGEEIHPSLGGRDQVPGYGGSSITRRFTGKERDVESGLDYFGARYVSAAQGRFTTADRSERPQPIPYADLNDPQSFNRYAYVRNSPLIHTDPDGRNAVLAGLFGAGILMGIEGARQVHSGRYSGPVERNTRLLAAGAIGFVLAAGTRYIAGEATTVGGFLLGEALLGASGVAAHKVSKGVIDGAVDVAKGGTGENVEAPKVIPTLIDMGIGAITTVISGVLGNSASSALGSVGAEHGTEAGGELLIHAREEKRGAEPPKQEHPKPIEKPPASETEYP